MVIAADACSADEANESFVAKHVVSSEEGG